MRIDELVEVNLEHYEALKLAVAAAPPIHFDFEMRSTKRGPNWFTKFMGGPSDQPLWDLEPAQPGEEETLP